MGRKKAIHADRLVMTETEHARTYTGTGPHDDGVIVIPTDPERPAAISYSAALVAKFVKRSRSKDDKEMQALVIQFYQPEDREVRLTPEGFEGQLDHHTPFAQHCFDAIRRGDSTVFDSAADTLEAMERTLLREVDTLLDCCDLLVDIAAGKPARVRQLAEEQLASLLLDRGSPNLLRQLAKLVNKAGEPSTRRAYRRTLMKALPVHLLLHRCLHDCATELRQPPQKRQLQQRHEKLFGSSVAASTLTQELERMGFGWLGDGRRKEV
jgi:hypothetical protein